MNWATLRGRLPSTDPLILGVYAWALTVATPCFESDPSLLTGLMCFGSVLLLIAGWVLLSGAPRMADALGTLGFCGMSVCTLIRLGSHSVGLDTPTVRLTMGAMVWCLFAISWARARHFSPARAFPEVAVAIPDVAGGPSNPLAPRLAIAMAGVICAIVIALYGTPRSDGHGVLVAGLIVVASLKLTPAAGTLLARIERVRAARHSKAQPAP